MLIGIEIETRVVNWTYVIGSVLELYNNNFIAIHKVFYISYIQYVKYYVSYSIIGNATDVPAEQVCSLFKKSL